MSYEGSLEGSGQERNCGEASCVPPFKIGFIRRRSSKVLESSFALGSQHTVKTGFSSRAIASTGTAQDIIVMKNMLRHLFFSQVDSSKFWPKNHSFLLWPSAHIPLLAFPSTIGLSFLYYIFCTTMLDHVV